MNSPMELSLSELRSFSDIWEGGMPGYIIWLNARLYEMKRLLKKYGYPPDKTAKAVDIGGKVKYLAAGGEFSIAVTEDRVVNYWGTDRFKQPAEIKDAWYKNCTNPKSYTTLEKWEQDTDYIQIYNRNIRTGELSEKPVCYERASIIRAMETQVFANWVTLPDKTLNVMGYGGGPGKKRFYKTFLYYVDYTSYILLKDPTIREYIRELKYPNQRIGNLEGSFGIGENHGQSPGFDIYSLKPKNL